MPIYEYRCVSCRKLFSVERSIHDDDSTVSCASCGSNTINRIWNAYIRTSGITPDIGQGIAHTGSSKSGCGSCSSHSCGSCH